MLVGVIAICVVLAIYSYPFIKAAWISYTTSWQPVIPNFEPIDFECLPPTASGYFDKTAKELGDEGFTTVAFLRQTNINENSTLYLTILKNKSTKDMACILDLTAQVKHIVTNHQKLTFCTEFVDQEVITTSNFNLPTVFKKLPEIKQHKFPSVRDPKYLYKIHLRLVARADSGRAKYLPSDGMDVFYLSQSEAKIMQKQVDKGMFYLDEENNVFRPTLKNAFSMVWKLGWPLQNILQNRMKQEELSTLQSIDMTEQN